MPVFLANVHEENCNKLLIPGLNNRRISIGSSIPLHFTLDFFIISRLQITLFDESPTDIGILFIVIMARQDSS